jgi:hypothetical protein
VRRGARFVGILEHSVTAAPDISAGWLSFILAIAVGSGWGSGPVAAGALSEPVKDLRNHIAD